MKEVKLFKLRSILKKVAAGYELGKKYLAANKTNVSSLEKPCMIRESQGEEEDPKTNDSILTEEREDSSSMSASDTPKEKEEEPNAAEASDK